MIPMELHFIFVCYFYIHFHLISTVEVTEMYEKFEEMVPKIAIFYHNTNKMKLFKQTE